VAASKLCKKKKKDFGYVGRQLDPLGWVFETEGMRSLDRQAAVHGLRLEGQAREVGIRHVEAGDVCV
jgi:hypothetical protein